MLVDGYNIIFAWDELNRLANSSLEDARRRLIELMQNYQGMKRIKVIVVFDAHHVKGSTEKKLKYDNIYVVFTKEAQTADSYIERTANVLKKNYKVTVATSDNMEQIIIMGRGAERMSASELERDVKLVKKQIRNAIESYKPVKSNTILDNLDAETAAWLEEMRRR